MPYTNNKNQKQAELGVTVNTECVYTDLGRQEEMLRGGNECQRKAVRSNEAKTAGGCLKPFSSRLKVAKRKENFCQYWDGQLGGRRGGWLLDGAYFTKARRNQLSGGGGGGVICWFGDHHKGENSKLHKPVRAGLTRESTGSTYHMTKARKLEKSGKESTCKS